MLLTGKLKQTAEKLLERSLRADEGMDEKEIAAAEEKLSLKIPPPLRDFYRNVGKMDCFMRSFERFLPPEEWQLLNGKLLFLEENQSVCYWGADVAEDDPAVYMCTDDDNEWYPEEMKLSEFLFLMLHYQLVQGDAECGGGYVCTGTINGNTISNDALNTMTADWEKAVSHNGLAIYWQSGKLLWYFTDPSGNLDRENDATIFVTTRTTAQFQDVKEKYGFTLL